MSAFSKARSYSKIKHNIAIADILLSLAFFILIQISGFSSFLARSVSNISANTYLTASIYIVVIGLFLNILGLPLNFLSSFKIEHRFGLSRQGLASWAKDYAKQIIISGLIYFIFILVIYHFLRVSHFWWVYTALIYFAFSIVLAKIFPIVIIPLFYRLSEISGSPLKERLISLAERAGAKILSVYKVGLGEKTKKANAALCGLGSTKRILLSDTLIQDYTEDEIEATLAHELAHHQYRHFWKLTFFGFASTLLSFIIADAFLQRAVSAGLIMYMHDISYFPVLALIFITYNVAVTPLLNSISRMYEAEADRVALQLTERPAALASLMKKLTVQNLSDPQPSRIVKFFFYDHPPASERIKMCEDFKR